MVQATGTLAGVLEFDFEFCFFFHRRFDCDEDVTHRDIFSFYGGSLGGKSDRLLQHADSLLLPLILTYQKIIIIDERLGCLVSAGQISKGMSKFVVKNYAWLIE